MGEANCFGNAGKNECGRRTVDIAVYSTGNTITAAACRRFSNKIPARVYIISSHRGNILLKQARRANGWHRLAPQADMKDHGQIVLPATAGRSGEGLSCFSVFRGRDWFSQARVALKMRGRQPDGDDFAHEQNLIVTETGKTVDSLPEALQRHRLTSEAF
jgi:hypothetical protein